jgi:hypothetical protein
MEKQDNEALKIRSFVDSTEVSGIYKISSFELQHISQMEELPSFFVRVEQLPENTDICNGWFSIYNTEPPKNTITFIPNGLMYDDHMYIVHGLRDNRFLTIPKPIEFYFIEITDKFIDYRIGLRTSFEQTF